MLNKLIRLFKIFKLRKEFKKIAKQSNGDWKPNWKKGNKQIKYGIVLLLQEVIIYNTYDLNKFLFKVAFKDYMCALNTIAVFNERIREIYYPDGWIVK